MRRVRGNCQICGTGAEFYLDDEEPLPKFCACPMCRVLIALTDEPARPFSRHPHEERHILNCAIQGWKPSDTTTKHSDKLGSLDDLEVQRVRLMKMDYQSGKYGPARA